MTRETIWLIIAGLAALLAVPLIYLGLQNNNNALVTAGFIFFTAGMAISPVTRIAKSLSERNQAQDERANARRA